jgi:hypothetical protein
MVWFWLFMALALLVIIGNALLLLRSGAPLRKRRGVRRLEED